MLGGAHGAVKGQELSHAASVDLPEDGGPQSELSAARNSYSSAGRVSGRGGRTDGYADMSETISSHIQESVADMQRRAAHDDADAGSTLPADGAGSTRTHAGESKEPTRDFARTVLNAQLVTKLVRELKETRGQSFFAHKAALDSRGRYSRGFTFGASQSGMPSIASPEGSRRSTPAANRTPAASPLRVSQLRSLDSPQSQDEQVTANATAAWLLDPRSPRRTLWTAVLLLLTVWSVTWIPWEIGFSVSPPTFIEILDIVTDCFFFVDLVLNLLSWVVLETGELITTYRITIPMYLRSFFVIDLLSTVPFDKLAVAILDPGEDLTVARTLAIIRILRVLRLLKLARVVKLKRLLGAVHGRRLRSVGRAIMRLLKLMVSIFYIMHLMACGFHFVHVVEVGEEGASASTWVRDAGLEESSNGSRYIAAVYWAVTTMMSVGYGDISAVSTTEMVYSIVSQIAGAACFGIIIANISSIVQALNAHQMGLNREVNLIKEYMIARKIPRELQERVVQYALFYYSRKSVFDESTILSILSPSLRNEIVRTTYRDAFDHIYLFKGVEDNFFARLVSSLKPHHVAPGQFVAREGSVGREMYFLLRGSVEVVCVKPPSRPIGMEHFEPGLQAFEALEDESYNPLPEVAQVAQDLERQTTSVPVARGTSRFSHRPSSGVDSEPASLIAKPSRLASYESEFNEPIDSFIEHHRRNFVFDLLSPASAPVSTPLFSDEGKPTYVAPKSWQPYLLGIITDGRHFGELSLLAGTRRPYGFRCSTVCDLYSIARGDLIHALAGFDHVKARLVHQARRHGEVLLSKKLALYERSRPGPDYDSDDFEPTKDDSAKFHGSTILLNFRKEMPVQKLPSGLRLLGTSSAQGQRLYRTLSGSYGINQFRDLLHDPGPLKEDVSDDAELLRHFILHDKHSVRTTWDLIIMVLVVVTVIQVPYAVAFALPSEVFLLVVERTIDIAFFIDIILNFRTAYTHPESSAIVVDTRLMASNYLRTSFMMDFLSTFPFDSLVSVFLPDASDEAAQREQDRLNKLLRLFRLLKLMRLTKLTRLLMKQQEKLVISPALLSLLSILTQVSLFAHVMGCFWYFAADVSSGGLDNPDPSPNWVSKVRSEGIQSTNTASYTAAMYYSFTTMTTVGYGDVVPVNDVERAVATLFMLLGASCFGYIVGSVSALVNRINANVSLKNEKMERMLEYIADRGLPRVLGDRILGFYEFYLRKKSAFPEDRILGLLPEALKNEVLVCINADLLSNVTFFQTMDDDFMADLLGHIHPQMYLPNEVIFREGEVSTRIARDIPPETVPLSHDAIACSLSVVLGDVLRYAGRSVDLVQAQGRKARQLRKTWRRFLFRRARVAAQPQENCNGYRCRSDEDARARASGPQIVSGAIPVVQGSHLEDDNFVRLQHGGA